MFGARGKFGWKPYEEQLDYRETTLFERLDEISTHM
jgi:hypothetical protein